MTAEMFTVYVHKYVYKTSTKEMNVKKTAKIAQVLKMEVFLYP